MAGIRPYFLSTDHYGLVVSTCEHQNSSHNYAVSLCLDMFSHTVKIALYSHAQ